MSKCQAGKNEHDAGARALPEGARGVDRGDVILVLIALAGHDVGKDVIPPEAGRAIRRRRRAGLRVCAGAAVMAMQVVCQYVRVLEGLFPLHK